jgi:DNA-binding beta-propeller fold protein YncE
MAVVLGTDGYRYEVDDGWAKLPPGMEFNADVAAVGVDKHDNVYAFNRGDHPVAVFDKDGNLLRTWGEGLFPRPHGVHVAPDDTIWLTDDADHTVRHCTLDGKILLTIGVPGKPAPYMSGDPFHRCTHTALSPQCDHVYVSDGYGNARIHKYSIDGKLEKSWGESGTDPGQFNIAHNICCDPAGWIYLADRENHRVQVFDGNGKYEAQWNNLHRPCGIFMTHTHRPICYIGELGPVQPVNRNSPNLGPRVSIVDNQGKLLSRFGDMHAGTAPTAFLGPHGLAADSRGDLYVGEVSWTQWPQFFPETPRPSYIRSLQKYEKVT